VNRKIYLVGVLMLSAALAGCSGSSSTGVSKDTVSGTWSGTWKSSNGQGGNLVGSWSQNGQTFSGPITVYNSVCFGKEPSTGTVSGAKINVGIVNNGIIFDGNVSGNTISGAYVVYRSGPCYGDAGTFVLRR